MPDYRHIRGHDMPHRRLTCLIVDPSEANMPNMKRTCLIGDLDMFHLRPKCLIRDPLETNMPYRRPTYLIGNGDPLGTDIPHQRLTCPIRDQYAPCIKDRSAQLGTNMHVDTHRRPTCLQSPIGILTHIYINILSFRWGMSVSYGSPNKHVVVSDGSPIGLL